MSDDYYVLLDIPRDADETQIKKAYRKLAMKHHPDRGGDEVVFKQIGEAYAVLSDPQKRGRYDQFGKQGVDESGGGMGGGGHARDARDARDARVPNTGNGWDAHEFPNISH